MKIFCSSKDNIKEMKRQTTDLGENIWNIEQTHNLYSEYNEIISGDSIMNENLPRKTLEKTLRKQDICE